MSKEDITIDELARMVARGFDQVVTKLGKEIGGIDAKVENLRSELSEFRKQNERDHLDLKLRQDNVAHRFELQDLEDRVTRLEKKAKLC